MKKSVIVDVGKELQVLMNNANTLRARIQLALDIRDRVMVERLVEAEAQVWDKIAAWETFYNAPMTVTN